MPPVAQHLRARKGQVRRNEQIAGVVGAIRQRHQRAVEHDAVPEQSGIAQLDAEAAADFRDREGFTAGSFKAYRSL